MEKYRKICDVAWNQTTSPLTAPDFLTELDVNLKVLQTVTLDLINSQKENFTPDFFYLSANKCSYWTFSLNGIAQSVQLNKIAIQKYFLF